MARLFFVVRTVWHAGHLHCFRKKVELSLLPLPLGTRVPFMTRNNSVLKHDIIATVGSYTHYFGADPERGVETGDIFIHLKFHPYGDTYEDDDDLTFTEWLGAQEGWESSHPVY